MLKSINYFVLGVLFNFALLLNANAQSQLKTPAPSPTQTIKQAFALSEIVVDYSRPSAKGRVVYGDLVPFGKLWRTGANASTKINFGENVKIDGNPLVAGTYALYSIPNKDSWDVIFYKDLNLSGNVAKFKQEDEVLRIKVKPSTLSYSVETFTINLADVKSNSLIVELLWEKTKVAFNVTAEIDEKIMQSIESSLAVDARPYFLAANYYYENDKDLNKALEWVNKAIESNPNAFWMQALKAKIQYKMKDYKGATETANKVVTLAKEASNDDYVKIGQKIIEDSKGKK